MITFVVFFLVKLASLFLTAHRHIKAHLAINIEDDD